MLLSVLRGALILSAAAVAALYLLSNQESTGLLVTQFAVLLIGTLAVTGTVVAVDVASKRKKLSSASGLLLGLAAGLLTAYALSFVVDYIGQTTAPDVGSVAERPAVDETLPETERLAQEQMIMRQQRLAQIEYEEKVRERDAWLNLFQGLKIILGMICCYGGMSLVLQTKDDFRFIIPYVEFTKQVRGTRPTLLDTSAVIDGRIIDVINTRILQGMMIVPQFVIEELHTLADTRDPLKRARGRRGLDILQKLRGTQLVEVSIDDTQVDGAGVDQKIITLAEEKRARVLSLDFALNQIAEVRGIDVISLNGLAKALRPVVLPGETLRTKLVKPGENPKQGVGYLDDGTMIVVENGREHLGHEVELEVTSTLQTNAGRMVFGRFVEETDATDAAPDSPGQSPPEAQTVHTPSVKPVAPDASPSSPPKPKPKSSARSRRGPASGSPRNPRRS